MWPPGVASVAPGGGPCGSKWVAYVALGWGGGPRGSRGGLSDFPKCSLMTSHFTSGQAYSMSRQAGGHVVHHAVVLGK